MLTAISKTERGVKSVGRNFNKTTNTLTQASQTTVKATNLLLKSINSNC